MESTDYILLKAIMDSIEIGTNWGLNEYKN